MSALRFWRFIGRGRHHCTIVSIVDVCLKPALHKISLTILPGFYRDLALGGPYFSPFLLNVIFAHACRHMKDDDPKFASLERGRHFMQKAKQLLLIEMEQDKPKICTIQGLLILGGRQCAIGKSSEGWLYTGMVCDSGTCDGSRLTLPGKSNDHRSWAQLIQRKHDRTRRARAR